MNYRKYFILLFIFSSIIIVITIFISLFKLDIKLAAYFYKNNSWYLAKTQPWLWIYKYGTFPSIVLTIISLIVYIVSFVQQKLIPFRRQALLVIVTLIIGPGLISNSLLKDRWGRPRPRQIQQFNGKWEFREIWQPGTPGKGKSFPCGHATMGFHFIVVYYIFKNRNKLLSYSGLIFSLIFGSFIGLTRIIQGGHFLSDTLWAGAITYLVASILYWVILKIPQYEQQKIIPQKFYIKPTKTRIALITISIISTISILIWIFLFSRPFYKESKHFVPQDLNYAVIHLKIENKVGDIYIEISDQNKLIRLQTTSSGFGQPKKTLKSNFQYHIKNDTLNIDYEYIARGNFNEIDSKTQANLICSKPIIISAFSENGDINIDRKDADALVKIQNIKSVNGEIIKTGF